MKRILKCVFVIAVTWVVADYVYGRELVAISDRLDRVEAMRSAWSED